MYHTCINYHADKENVSITIKSSPPPFPALTPIRQGNY